MPSPHVEDRPHVQIVRLLRRAVFPIKGYDFGAEVPAFVPPFGMAWANASANHGAELCGTGIERSQPVTAFPFTTSPVRIEREAVS
jgi:hypothetical protein